MAVLEWFLFKANWFYLVKTSAELRPLAISWILDQQEKPHF